MKDARTVKLEVAAPRGQIVDRNGVPLAQNVVVTYLGVNFSYMDAEPDEKKIAYARERLNKANQLLGKNWTLDDADILDHYKNRRWLPLIFSRLPLPEDDRKKIEALAMPGLILLPTYQRIYPQQQLAGHIIGYVGKRPPWPKGQVPDGESMWPTAHGVQGLEKSFDQQLTGVDGRVRIIFNEQGERVEEELIRAPVPGLNVVTTLDVEMQRLAEQLTEKHVRRGAFVLMEVQTGDILAMASYPRYDPNEFVPMISADRFNALNTDKEQPLLGRAFQGEYPPASTFKVFSALGLLHAGTITSSSIYDCPSSFTIGDRIARNWNEHGEGRMNVIGALARSCNTWFFAGAMETDPPYITGMGVEFGFGRKTGIPIEESSGLMPTNEWWMKQYGAKIGRGDLCNISIGQGSVLATPLQIAQAMTGIANRHSFAQSRLVLQVQDFQGQIVDTYDVVTRDLHVPPRNIDIVQRGMFEVVNNERGTGKNAAHPKIHVSGKTGTGQWKPAKSQNIAWFAGFAPSEYPVYAFAAVYEGQPGEKIGGGSKAAPIIGDFFQEYLTEPRLVALEELSRELPEREAGSPLPSEDPSLGAIFYDAPSVDPLAGMTPTAPEAKKPTPGQSLFKSLFGGGKKGR
jgi:penicillin-binding protein 2